MLTHPIAFRRDRLYRPLSLSLCSQIMRNKDMRESYSYKEAKRHLKKMGEGKIYSKGVVSSLD